MKSLFEAIDQIKALAELNTSAVGAALELKLVPKTVDNPFWFVHQGETPLFTLELWQPAEGATLPHGRVVLQVAADAQLTQTDVERQLGPGKIGDVVPDAEPEGLVSVDYQEPAQRISFDYLAESKKLVTVVIDRDV